MCRFKKQIKISGIEVLQINAVLLNTRKNSSKYMDESSLEHLMHELFVV